MNAQLALLPKGFQIMKNNESVPNERLATFLAENNHRTIIDAEDEDNRYMTMLTLYFTDKDLTARLIGSSRDYFFEMDCSLAAKFI